ncbi:MAG: TRAP transporter TatT component family protein [Treponema sp.]|nr:TRAP transporter TatT component family protein [Treponema sp.]
MILNRYIPGCWALLSLALLGSGCSINRMAVNAVADALTGEGGSEVFTADSDPELVGDAIPFAIKMYESLLSQAPDHQGLILTTGSLFVMYANAFVQGPAEFLPPIQYEEREAAMKRAKMLYLRGAGILQGGLEKKYPGIGESSAESGTMAPYLAKMKKGEVPLLYWTAAAYLSAYSLDPFDFPLSHKVADAMAFIDRAYALDPDFNRGALDDFYVLALASLPDTMGGDLSRVETHFSRSLEKSGGLLAGSYVSYAQAVAVPAQDYGVFKKHLETALALDADADPPNRLVNIISQRKARALLDNAGNFFILLDDEEYE